VIFSRGRGSGGRHHKDERRSGRHSATSRPDPDESVEPVDAEEVVLTGPYDLSEAPDDLELIDLGSLKIPVVEGVEVRVQAAPDGSVQQILLIHRDSVLQLAAFAAPRSQGIWDEARGDIKSSLFADGVAVEEEPGEYGPELRARVRTPEGLKDLRFLGIDGPRWMVRAIYQGPAAVDPATAAGPLAECLRNVVVDRGREAMPALEGLPLRLPKEFAEQQAAAAQAAAAQAAAVPAQSGGTGQSPPPANGAEPGTPAPRRRPSPRPRRSR
jgi:hypothetical protein